MNRARDDSIKAIVKISDMLDSKKIDIKEISNILGNWSYSSGMHYSLKLDYKYFEF